ncbi:hypothetical protein [Terriglobus aquaticus]|uniref:Uncharacterized protein n=1 Tax=Terriglobus aquaticus TaxID=940139 RepID=A0ABW9KR32_9BACT|nr:hypothetical protein [Terriglobus aquaticus]
MGQTVGFPSCRHILTNGEKCESPAWSGRHFCYYHTLYRRRNKPNKKTTPALNVAIVDNEDKWHRVEAIEPFAKRYTLGPLEDAASIQVAISTVLNALADQRIDHGRASTLLYGLQLASNNLRALQTATDSTPKPPVTPCPAVTYAQVPASQELTAPIQP